MGYEEDQIKSDYDENRKSFHKILDQHKVSKKKQDELVTLSVHMS